MWNEVRTQGDIDLLLQTYGGFHDSCIVGMEYMSGASVDIKKRMYFCSMEDRRLDILFHRQWDPIELELSFTGVRKFSIVGWQDNYFCDIYGASLTLECDLIPGRDDPLIVWRDGDRVRPENLIAGLSIPANDYSYIVAKNLSWRLLDR